jgi:dethiobiotin synthetase
MPPVVIYIAGVKQHAGKTVTSLGLIHALSRTIGIENIGYIKPVGQEVKTDKAGHRVDKDAFIIDRFACIPDLDMSYVSPVTLASGVTKQFLRTNDQPQATARMELTILQALESMASKKVVIAEGTGHPGVGGVVGLSNARVSSIMDARILYLAGGGIGRTLDEMEVNLTYFRHGLARVQGVVFNKLIPDKIDQMKEIITEELLQQHFDFPDKLRIFGFLPSVPHLHNPSMDLIRQHFKQVESIGDATWPAWFAPIRKTRIISQSHVYFDAVENIRPREVAIIGAGSVNRMKLILDMQEWLPPEQRLAGMIMTCDEEIAHKQKHVERLTALGIPSLYVQDNTSSTDQKIYKLFSNTKLQLYDEWKFKEIKRLFDDHFDTERFARIFNLY